MLIPTGTVHKARLTGSTLKEVDCFRCRTKYFYWMSRTARGRASAPLFVGMAEADAQAAEQAWTQLNLQLSEGVDAVCCPGCGSYQPSMIAFAKDKKMSMQKILLFSVIAFLAPLLTVGMMYDADNERVQTIVGTAAYLLGFATLISLIVWRGRLDPNRDAAARIGLNTAGQPRRFYTREEAESVA